MCHHHSYKQSYKQNDRDLTFHRDTIMNHDLLSPPMIKSLWLRVSDEISKEAYFALTYLCATQAEV